jgi:8-oxo-dGTP pyrophosphatase MutT (NUDIX family)
MTLHSDAVQVLTTWDAPSATQEKARLAFLDHLALHEDGMWRSCAAGHLTASTVLLDSTRTQVLLTLHGKLKVWLQLGGHCEPEDSTLFAAALREATEESGISGLTLLPSPVQLDRHSVRCHPQGSFHLDVQYLAIAPPGAQATISAESDDLRWFPVDALPQLTDDVLRRLVARAVALPY